MTYEEALNLVEKAFAGKTDKGGHPYFQHCYRVSQDVPLRLRIPAALHDILEDCPEWTVKRLLDKGVTPVDVALIKLLTHRKEDSYQEYIRKISADPDATIIKRADLRDNMCVWRLKAITDKDIKRLQKYHIAYNSILKYEQYA